MKVKKKTIMMILVVVAILILVACGGYFGYQKYQEYLLSRETDKIGNLDILNDKVDTKIYTSGDYAVVEKTMKDYISDYGKVSQQVIALVDDDTLKNLLTVERIEQDGKEFNETLTYLNQKKTDIETVMNQMIAMTSDQEIMNAIKKTNVPVSYQNLYRKMMLDSDIAGALKQEQNDLIDTREKTIAFIDDYIKIFEFLKANDSSYMVSNGQILFQNESLYQQYQTLVNNLQN